MLIKQRVVGEGWQGSMGDQEHKIQINTEADSWVEQMNRELNRLTQSRFKEEEVWEGESIYRVPWSLKKLSKNNPYDPQTASIGPYHHGTKNLKDMEKHKQRALLNFLHRNNKPLQCYVNELERKVDNLMGAYHQLQPKWKQNKDAFLRLMILDGCFMLELMQTHTKSDTLLKEMGYSTNDPVFSRHGQLYFGPFLRRDMLMLENQIPMLVLYIILLVAGVGDEKQKLNNLINKFFSHTDTSSNQSSEDCWIKKFFFPRQTPTSPDQHSEDFLHILDLHRKSLLKIQKPQESESRENQNCYKSRSLWREICDFKEEEPYIRSATELDGAGIRFKKSETKKLNDISFKCGVLKLPVIEVDDALESEYLNMMAFERFHPKAGSEVTSYVFLMDRLIDSEKDVSLLHWRRILRNSLGSDEAVATLFNSLSMETCLDPGNSLYEVQKKVTKYYRSRLRRCMAYARHTYFTNAWVALSLVAAILLFALTIIQTIYAILDFYKKDP